MSGPIVKFTTEHNGTQFPTWVNVATLRHFWQQESGTALVFDQDHRLYVVDPPERVAALIENAKR